MDGAPAALKSRFLLSPGAVAWAELGVFRLTSSLAFVLLATLCRLHDSFYHFGACSKMAGVLDDRMRLYRLLSVVHFVGRSFLKLFSFTSVVKRYVCGEKEELIGAKRKRLDGDEASFVGEVESLFYLFPEMNDVERCFDDFHAYTVNSGKPMATVLVSAEESCRKCLKPLVVDPNTHVVVIYHEQRGTYLGSRVTKCCRGCKIYEHYGYWSIDGRRYFNDDCLKKDFLLSSEDTAFQMALVKQCANFLVVGAVPFSTFAETYNRRFEYPKCVPQKGFQAGPAVKRIKREKPSELHDLITAGQSLDRRRLEEGFLLYASLEVIKRHNLPMDSTCIPYNRNELAEMVTGKFREAFVEKWGDHVCDTPGCRSVLVLDGNMKNCRQVCACRDVGELKFAGLEGTIVVGCQNTPAKGFRYCEVHKEVAREYQNDEEPVGKQSVVGQQSGLLVVGIINEKSLRQQSFYEVLWSDGRRSWLKESNVPKKVLELHKSGKNMQQAAIEIEEFGQSRAELQLNDEAVNGRDATLRNVVKSTGFGVESSEDNMVGEEGKTRKLLCGTEKGQHKCKNYRTAGILVMERPCSIVVDIKEIFGSESKSQVYAHIHNLFESPSMDETTTICYDDACHLKRFVQNPKRSMKTKVAQKLNKVEILCDKFHFKNHTDSWCKTHCNPMKSQSLQNVNTEVCEQLFSWLSKFSHITKHMNRWRFLFVMLYILDTHNEDVHKKNLVL